MEAVYINNSCADFTNQNPENSLSYNSYSSVYHNRRHHQQNQPPLPISKHYQKRVKINTNTNNHRSLTVRKSSSSVVNSGREKPKYQSEKLISFNSANNQIGPDPKDVPRAFFLCNGNRVNNFSGSVVSTVLSPPPSSLPLPTFSLRLKTSCNTEAAAGATDNLRRILRLC